MLRPPLWAQWAISLAVAAAAIVALVLFVSANDHDYSIAKLDPAAVRHANLEAEQLTAQDQVPHRVLVGSTKDPRAALVHVVRADMTRRIAGGAVAGTLQRISCTPSGTGIAAPAFSCVATVSSVNYLYVGVVHVKGHRLVWCRHDEPVVPGHWIPLDPSCLR